MRICLLCTHISPQAIIHAPAARLRLSVDLVSASPSSPSIASSSVFIPILSPLCVARCACVLHGPRSGVRVCSSLRRKCRSRAFRRESRGVPPPLTGRTTPRPQPCTERPNDERRTNIYDREEQRREHTNRHLTRIDERARGRRDDHSANRAETSQRAVRSSTAPESITACSPLPRDACTPRHRWRWS
jgi:hypothetical protein